MIPGLNARVYIEELYIISLTKMNHSVIIINADQIEIIESTPDTVITLLTGHKYIVVDTAEEVVEKVIKYKQRIYNLQV